MIKACNVMKPLCLSSSRCATLYRHSSSSLCRLPTPAVASNYNVCLCPLYAISYTLHLLFGWCGCRILNSLTNPEDTRIFSRISFKNLRHELSLYDCITDCRHRVFVISLMNFEYILENVKCVINHYEDASSQ